MDLVVERIDELSQGTGNPDQRQALNVTEVHP